MGLALLGRDGKTLSICSLFNFSFGARPLTDPPAKFGYAPSAAGCIAINLKKSFLYSITGRADGILNPQQRQACNVACNKSKHYDWRI